MSLRALACCALLLACTWRPAAACSLRPDFGLTEGFVLYGEVVEHVQTIYLSKPAWGIRIAPRHVFRIPEPSASGTYDVYPLGLAPDCAPIAASTPEELARFRIGAAVRIVGDTARNTPIPGDIYASGRLATVSAQCDVAALAEMVHEYASGRADACIDEGFELNKDLALLETRAARRIEILERVARFPYSPISYLDLVAKYAPDPATGKRLLALRYGEAAAAPCGTPAPDLEQRDEAWRARREEFCGQRNPYDPAAAADFDLNEAIAYGRLDRVQAFLRDGGDPNRPLRIAAGHWPPLKLAVYSDQEPIALALLEAGADFERSGTDASAITQNGMGRVLSYLLTQSPGRLREEFGFSAACWDGDYEIVDIVTKHAAENGVDLGALLPNVFVGCVDRNPDAVRLAHERGVPVTDVELYAAASSGSLGMVRYLLAAGADPFARRSDAVAVGDPLYGAAAIDYALLRYEGKDEDAKRRARYVIHELLAVGPLPKNGAKLEGMAQDAMQEVNAHEEPSERLVAAARLGLYDVVQQLLAAADASPSTLAAATDAALRARYPDIARLLLAAGAAPGGGALHTAAQAGPAGIVRHLIALGADVDERVGGLTPIDSWYAGETGGHRRGETLEALLEGGADGCPLLAKLAPHAEGRGVVLRAQPDCAQ